MKVLPRVELYHKSPSLGLVGGVVLIDTDAPPPPPPPTILIVPIPAETVTVDIPGPLKSRIVAPNHTVPPSVAIPIQGFVRTDVATPAVVA
jgi:hypothetical protein